MTDEVPDPPNDEVIDEDSPDSPTTDQDTKESD